MRQVARDARSMFYEMSAMLRLSRLRPERPGKHHNLAGELIVSLTSYPARFDTLHLTLACLCDQTIRADRIILWVARDDFDQLPGDVCRLRPAIEIRTCENLGAFKKLIPALEQFPEAFIVTADDDLYYSRDWLETILNGYSDGIVTMRGHPILGDTIDWRPAKGNSGEMIPGSGAGTLFPPHSLHPMATDRRFLELAAQGDDIWYYWMAKLNGTSIRNIGNGARLKTWVGSQDHGLWARNGHSGFDEQYRRVRDAVRR